MTSKVRVKFVRPSGIYNVREVAAFDAAEAHKLVKAKVAELVVMAPPLVVAPPKAKPKAKTTKKPPVDRKAKSRRAVKK